MLNGHVWKFVGYDEYRLTSLPGGWDCGGSLTDQELGAMLDGVAQSGGTVVRTWFMQAFGGPGNWTALDRVVSMAAARGIKVVATLTDQWASCEEWPAPGPRYRNLGWYQSGYTQVEPGNTLSYRDYAVAVAQHYASNPAIAFFQLVNEAEALDNYGGACQEAAANHALRAFADDVIGRMKAVDPNHLEDLGTIAGGQCGVSGSTDRQYLFAGMVDMCEYHDYYGIGPIAGDQWNGIQARIDDCHADGKPIWGGEVGIDSGLGGATTRATLAARAQGFIDKMNAQFPEGLAGMCIWEYAPPGAPSLGWDVAPGDPLISPMAALAGRLASGSL